MKIPSIGALSRASAPLDPASPTIAVSDNFPAKDADRDDAIVNSPLFNRAVNELNAQYATAENLRHAGLAHSNDLVGERQAFTTDKSALPEQAFTEGWTADQLEEAIATVDAKLHANRQAQDRNNAQTTEAVRHGSDARRNLARVQNLYAGIATLGLRIEPIAVKIKGRAVDVAVAAEEAIAELRARQELVENAPLPLSDVRESTLRELTAVAASAMPAIGVRGGLLFKEMRVGLAEGQAPVLATTVDPRPFFAYLAHDEIVAHIDASLSERYRGVEAFSEPDRKRELARLEGAILEQERILAAALWSRIDAGEQVFFPLMSPHSIVGVNGPPLRQPRRGPGEF